LWSCSVVLAGPVPAASAEQSLERHPCQRAAPYRRPLASRWGSEFGRVITTTWFELAA
jgi:hypothetical protein